MEEKEKHELFLQSLRVYYLNFDISDQRDQRSQYWGKLNLRIDHLLSNKFGFNVGEENGAYACKGIDIFSDWLKQRRPKRRY